MEIYNSLEKLKSYSYKNNSQIVFEGRKRIFELSGFSPSSSLYLLGKIDKYKDMGKYSKCIYKYKDEDAKKYAPYIDRWVLKNDGNEWQEIYNKNSPETFDTKKYWQWLHELFPFCDVSSYWGCNSLEEYDRVKGVLHYNDLIETHFEGGWDFFKNKKILEIGPGYGYLPKTLKNKNISSEYYCIDIVKRFNTDNFIIGNGYNIASFIGSNLKFDIIFMYDVSQHLSEAILTYLSEIKNILNENGIFYFNYFEQKHKTLGMFFNQTYIKYSNDIIEEHLKNTAFSFIRKPFISKHFGHESDIYEVKHNLKNIKYNI